MFKHTVFKTTYNGKVVKKVASDTSEDLESAIMSVFEVDAVKDYGCLLFLMLFSEKTDFLTQTGSSTFIGRMNAAFEKEEKLSLEFNQGSKALKIEAGKTIKPFSNKTAYCVQLMFFYNNNEDSVEIFLEKMSK